MRSTTRKRGTYKDQYLTPQYCIEPLLDKLVWPDKPRILEPCKGTGIVIDTLAAGLPGATFDWCEIDLGRDFYNLDESKHWDFVITNPPFSQFQAFFEKSIRVADCVCFLLPMSALASKGRREWWQDKKPTGQITISLRPGFTRDGGKDSNDYAWFYWDKTGKQERGYDWL